MDSLLFAGIDLHEKFCFITIMNKEDLIVKEGKVFNEEDEIVLFFGQFKNQVKAAVEATYNVTVQPLEAKHPALFLTRPIHKICLAYSWLGRR